MKQLFLTLACLLSVLIGQAATTITDEITAADLKATGTSYQDFTETKFKSEALYCGNSAKNAAGAIQLRSDKSNSGIVTTKSGGTVESVKITVASGTKTIDVYGKNEPYAAASDLYGANRGTKLGFITTTGTIDITGDYKYIGIRSNSGAVYISSIEITWEPETGGGTTQTVADPVFSVTESNVAPGSTVDISCSTEGAQLEVSANDDPIDGISSNPYTYTFPAEDGKVTLTAKAYITDQSGTKTYSNAVSTTYTVSTTPTPPVGTTKWEQTDIKNLASGDVVIIVDTYSKTALDPNGTSSSPTATPVTLNDDQSEITADADENMWFEIIKSGTDYSFEHVSTSTGTTSNKLYTTNNTTGVRVGGTNTNNTFTWTSSGYLQNTVTKRYLGVYIPNTGIPKDWRCYDNTTGNIKSTQTAFYKRTVPTCELPVFTVNGVTLAEDIMEVEPGTEVTVSCPTAGATIKSLTINGTDVTFGNVPQTSYTFRIYEKKKVEVKYINGEVLSEPATASFDLKKVEGQFTLTTSLSEFNTGDQMVLVNQTQGCSMSSLPTTGSAKANTVTLSDDQKRIASPLTNAEVFTVEKNDDGTISLRSKVLNGDSPLYLQYVGPSTEISIASLANAEGDLHKFDVKVEQLAGGEGKVEQLCVHSNNGRFIRYNGSEAWDAHAGVATETCTSFYRLQPPVEAPAAAVFTPAPGEVPYGTEVSVTCPTPGAKLDIKVYGTNTTIGKTDLDLSTPYTFTVTEDVVVEAKTWVYDNDGTTKVTTSADASYTIAKAAMPTFSPAGGVVPYNTEVTVSTTTAGAKLDVVAGNDSYTGMDSPFTFNVTAPVDVLATAYNVDAVGKKVAATESATAEASYAIKPDPVSSNVFKLATSIEPDREYIVLGMKSGSEQLMGALNGTYFQTVVSDNDKNFKVYGPTIIVNSNDVARIMFESASEGKWYVRYLQGDTDGYINGSSEDANKVSVSSTKQTASVSVTSPQGVGTMDFDSSGRGYFSFNSSANPTRFTCYKGKQSNFYLYAAVETPAPTAKESITFRNDTETASLTTIVTGYDWSSGTPTPIENNYMTSEVNDGYICVYYDGLATADQAAAAEVNNGVLKYDKGTYGAPEAAANYANAAQTSPVKLHVEVELLGNKDGEYSSYKMPNPDVPGGWDDQTYLKYYGVNQTRIHDVDAPYVKVPITSKYSVVRATATGDGVTHTGTVESDVHAYYSPNGSTTGVEDVEAGSDSDAEVKYYNLQGVRISRPSNGVYIRVEGQRVSKVRVF